MSSNDDQRKPSVLADLPQGRPQRRSERRAAVKPRVAAPAKPAATSKAAGTVAKVAAPKRKAAAPKPKATAKAKPAAKTAAPKAAPKLEPVAPAPPADQPFVATALQAAGELAHLGLAVGARAVRNAIDRLPKP
jgi:hypothetical protein